MTLKGDAPILCISGHHNFVQDPNYAWAVPIPGGWRCWHENKGWYELMLYAPPELCQEDPQ
jgi:hypothetical protein